MQDKAKLIEIFSLLFLGAFPARGPGTGLSLQFLDFTCGKVSGISALSLAQ
jgi:hypothetical protein